MYTIVLLLILLISIAIIDTIIGNRYFPGKVEVIKHNGSFIIRKRLRYFLIPIWRYLEYIRATNNYWLDDFTNFKFEAAKFNYKDAAIEVAKVLADHREKSKNKDEVVWSSKLDKIDESEEIIQLGLKLHKEKVSTKLD